MKVMKIIGAIALGLIGLVVLLYVIGVAVNWRDRPPTAAALELRKLQTDRAPVADADNAFIYVMGFSAPASEDPQVAGALRKAWIEAVNRDPALTDADPVTNGVDFEAGLSKSVARLAKQCHEHSVECRDAFAAAVVQPRMTLEELQLKRYRTLLQRPAWREVVPLDFRGPIQSYRDLLEAQRLLFVDLGAHAKSAPPSEIAQDLRADLAFWRETQKSADYLITKMIALAAIRQHFFFGNLVVREMPAGQPEASAAWAVPFSAEELSMHRVMAGELMYAEGTMRAWLEGKDARLIADPDDPRLKPAGRIASVLARPYYQPQDQFNHFAEFYLDVANRFAVPLEQYPRVAESIGELEPTGVSFHIYNATGRVLRGLVSMSAFSSYPMRVGSIEGMRRAALLTAQLRERDVPPEAVAEALKTAELFDPFTREPFEWDVDEKAVVYTGPAAEGARFWHPYIL
jgi:hypothetical protein